MGAEARNVSEDGEAMDMVLEKRLARVGSWARKEYMGRGVLFATAKPC